MKGYQINKDQRDLLIQQKMADGTRYNPVKDINGDYFIFEQEHEQCGLGVKAEYTPPPQEEI